jgi:cell shape-determining protein MreC
MKTYSSTKKGNYRRTSSKTRRYWLITLIAIIFIGFISPWLISKISALILYPFHATSAWIKNSDGILPTYLRSKDELVSEIESLKMQMSADTGTQQSIERLLEENMQLRSLAKAGNSENRLAARVLARPNRLAYDLLQIDKGSNDGVIPGSPVYTGLDSVVGVVVQVAANYSFVDLFTSPGFESSAFIIGPNIFSTIDGMGGGVARLRLPQGIDIVVGQLVILPGISSGVYGEIVHIENEPTQPEQYGYVVPPVALNSLQYVSVGVGEAPIKSDAEIEENVRTAIRNSFILSSSTFQMVNVGDGNSTSTEAGTNSTSSLQTLE